MRFLAYQTWKSCRLTYHATARQGEYKRYDCTKICSCWVYSSNAWLLQLSATQAFRKKSVCDKELWCIVFFVTRTPLILTVVRSICKYNPTKYFRFIKESWAASLNVFSRTKQIRVSDEAIISLGICVKHNFLTRCYSDDVSSERKNSLPNVYIAWGKKSMIDNHEGF